MIWSVEVIKSLLKFNTQFLATRNREILNLTKSISKYLTAKTILNGEMMKSFSLKTGTRLGYPP